MIRKISLRVAFILLCVVSMACTSCNWWDDVDHDVVRLNEIEAAEREKQTGPVPSQISVLYFNGMDKSQLRTISPTVSAIDFYKVTASLDGTVVSLDNVATSSFTLNLYKTGIWDILVEGYSGTPGSCILVARGTGTVTVGKAPLYGGSASVIIAPPITAGGAGQVRLKFKIPPTESVFTQDVQVYLGIKNVSTGRIYKGNLLYLKTAIEAGLLVEFITDTPTAGEIQLKDGNTPVTSIPSGEYEAEFKIYLNAPYGKNYYRHVEKLYVWDGCVTDTFFSKVSENSPEFNVDISAAANSANPVSIGIQEGEYDILVFSGATQNVKKVVSSEKGIRLVAYINAGQNITVTCGGRTVPIGSVVGNRIEYDLPDGNSSALVEIVSPNGAVTSSSNIYYGSVYVNPDSNVLNQFGSESEPFKSLSGALDYVKYIGDATHRKNALVDVIDFKLAGTFAGNEEIDFSELDGKTLRFSRWNLEDFTLAENVKFKDIATVMYFPGMNMGENALVSLCSGSMTHLSGRIVSKATSDSPSFLVNSGAYLYLDSGFDSDSSVGCKPLSLSLVADKDVADPGKLMVSSALPPSLGGKVSMALKKADGTDAAIADNIGTTVLRAAGSHLLTESDCDFFSLSDPNYFIALSSDKRTGTIRDRRATFVITKFPSQKIRLYDGATEVTDFSNMEKAKDYTLRAVVGGVEKQDVTVSYQVYQGTSAGPAGSGTINFGSLGLPADKYTLYMTYTYNGTTYSENMNFTLK